MTARKLTLPAGHTRMSFVVEALKQHEAGLIRRWQVINRLIHAGITAVEANLIADERTIPPHISRRLT